jgi:hypothetical protein
LEKCAHPCAIKPERKRERERERRKSLIMRCFIDLPLIPQIPKFKISERREKKLINDLKATKCAIIIYTKNSLSLDFIINAYVADVTGRMNFFFSIIRAMKQ